jgi:peroxiredoxin
MWVVGVAFVIVVAVAGLNAVRHSGGGLRGPVVGQPLPEFAAALSTGSSNDAANIRQQPAAGKPSACQVSVPGSVTSCALSRKPLVLTVIVPGVSKCEQQLDLYQRLASRFPGAQFAAVVSGKERAKVATLAQSHGWTFPVAVDPDLRVFNMLHVAICPTTMFVARGGRVSYTTIRPIGEAQIAERLRAIGGA